MKIRNSGGADEKIDINMTPMIDAVFLLLIFFMLTLNIRESEGNFDINMPAPNESPDVAPPPDVAIKVFLVANEDGSLAQIRLGGRPLGNDVPLCYRRLNGEIAALAGGGGAFGDDLEVEITADYGLHFEHALKAISACTGRLGPSGNLIRYVQSVKLTPPVRPAGD